MHGWLEEEHLVATVFLFFFHFAGDDDRPRLWEHVSFKERLPDTNKIKE